MDQKMSMGKTKSNEIIIETVDESFRNPLDIYRQEVGITSNQPKTIEDVKTRFNELLNSKVEDGFVIGGNIISDNKYFFDISAYKNR